MTLSKSGREPQFTGPDTEAFTGPPSVMFDGPPSNPFIGPPSESFFTGPPSVMFVMFAGPLTFSSSSANCRSADEVMLQHIIKYNL